jgi:hypothetical protein
MIGVDFSVLMVFRVCIKAGEFSLSIIDYFLSLFSIISVFWIGTMVLVVLVSFDC